MADEAEKLISISTYELKRFGCPSCREKDIDIFIASDDYSIMTCCNCHEAFGVSDSPSKKRDSFFITDKGKNISLVRKPHPNRLRVVK